MQNVRSVMTTPSSAAAFAPTESMKCQCHLRPSAACRNGSSLSLQAGSETATKATHDSSPLEDLATSCKEIQAGGAKMRYEQTIVHIVRNDLAGAKSLRDFFLSEGLSVVTFRTAAEYMAAPRDDRPTCLILDLDLPDLHGLDIQSRLADKDAPPVVFVTSHGDPVSVVRAMKNGAIDFMLEPVDYGQLMTAVELAFTEDLKKRTQRIEVESLLGRWESLTPRETEVFHYTVAGLLNKQAAAELGVAENTYQVHRGRVMRKMKANSLADLVRMSTKLEPILPTPRRTRICYGTAVVVPMRTAKHVPRSQSNVMTHRESDRSDRANALSPL